MSSFTREASDSRVEAGFLAPGSSRRFQPSPRNILEWQRPLARSGSGLAGYSGGTAQAFHLLPYYPPESGAPQRTTPVSHRGGETVKTKSHGPSSCPEWAALPERRL